MNKKYWRQILLFFILCALAYLVSSIAIPHDNTITFPMCNTSDCEHIPAYTIRAETQKPLSLAWNPPVCADCRVDWELVTVSFGGIVASGTSFENETANFSVDSPGEYELRYVTCTNISTAPVCDPPRLSRDEAAEAHGFVITIRLAAPGGGGIG